MLELYVAYLGGASSPGRLSEDHEVVLVVADDKRSADRAACAKWAGEGRGHVDSIRVVDAIDGYTVHLEPDSAIASHE